MFAGQGGRQSSLGQYVKTDGKPSTRFPSEKLVELNEIWENSSSSPPPPQKRSFKELLVRVLKGKANLKMNNQSTYYHETYRSITIM